MFSNSASEELNCIVNTVVHDPEKVQNVLFVVYFSNAFTLIAQLFKNNFGTRVLKEVAKWDSPLWKRGLL